jgi:hypothetical protein
LAISPTIAKPGLNHENNLPSQPPLGSFRCQSWKALRDDVSVGHWKTFNDKNRVFSIDPKAWGPKFAIDVA